MQVRDISGFLSFALRMRMKTELRQRNGFIYMSDKVVLRNAREMSKE